MSFSSIDVLEVSNPHKKGKLGIKRAMRAGAGSESCGASFPMAAYDDTKDPLMGRLVEIQVKDRSYRPGVVAFCETIIDESRDEVSSGLYRVAWGRFESTKHFLEVVSKRKNLKVRCEG